MSTTTTTDDDKAAAMPLARAILEGDWVRDYRLRVMSGVQAFETVGTEPNAVEPAIIVAAARLRMPVITWNCYDGFEGRGIDVRAEVARLEQPREPGNPEGLGDPGLCQPLSALAALSRFKLPRTGPGGGSAVFVLHNFYPFFIDPPVAQLFENLVRRNNLCYREHRTGAILRRPIHFIQAPYARLDLRWIETVRHWITPLPFPLPTEQELREGLVADLIAEARRKDPDAVITDEYRDALVAACRGLERHQVTNVLFYAGSKFGSLAPEVPATIRREAGKRLAEAAALEVVDEADIVPPEQLGGIRNAVALIEAAARTCTEAARAEALDPASGVYLIGMPGCLHADTPIYDPDDGTTRTVRERHEAGLPFHVAARADNGRPVIAMAYPPRVFEPADMVKLTFDDGNELCVTLAHRLWDGNDYVEAQQCARELHAGVACRLPTISARDLAGSLRDVRRSMRTAADSTADCSADLRRCDARPPRDATGGRGPVPSPADAPIRTHDRRSQDDRADAAGDILSASSRRRSTPDSRDPSETRTTVGLGPQHREAPRRRAPASIRALRRPLSGSYLPDTVRRRVADAPMTTHDPLPTSTPDATSNVATLTADESRTWRQSQPGSTRSGRASCTLTLHRPALGLYAAFQPPVGGDADSRKPSQYATVVKVEPCGRHPYYDFHVPVYNNYWAVNGWHHNSGKTELAKTASVLFQRTTHRAFTVLEVNMGALYGGIVGDTEHNWLDVERRIAAFGPDTVVVLNEVDKVFGGVMSSSGDSGVRQSLFGLVLKWAGDPRRRCFIVATMNSPEGIPGEFFRRFDGGFFFDLPAAAARREIARIHFAKRLARTGKDLDSLGLDAAAWDAIAAATAGWIPSEIEIMVKRARDVAFAATGVATPTAAQIMAVVAAMKGAILSVQKADQLAALRALCKHAHPVDRDDAGDAGELVSGATAPGDRTRSFSFDPTPE